MTTRMFAMTVACAIACRNSVSFGAPGVATILIAAPAPVLVDVHELLFCNCVWIMRGPPFALIGPPFVIAQKLPQSAIARLRKCTENAGFVQRAPNAPSMPD